LDQNPWFFGQKLIIPKSLAFWKRNKNILNLFLFNKLREEIKIKKILKKIL